MNAFDQLSKGLANGGLSRRDGLKLAFGGAAFAALSALGLGSAAAAPAPFESLCRGVAGTNCASHTKCGTNPNCFCFEHISRNGETYCGCNVNCADTKTCASSADCPAQTLCAVNTGVCDNCSSLTTGICIKKCKGQFQNCTSCPTCTGCATCQSGSCKCPQGTVPTLNGTCAKSCPQGGSQCSSGRCISTNEGNFCSNDNGFGSCSQNNLNCPAGSLCSGAICEHAC